MGRRVEVSSGFRLLRWAVAAATAGLVACAQAGLLVPQAERSRSDRLREARLERQLRAVEDERGVADPAFSATLHELADLQSAAGHPDEALLMVEASLFSRSTRLGDAHPSLAASNLWLAGRYQRTGDAERARAHAEQAVALLEDAAADPQLAEALELLAEVQREAGRPQSGRRLAERAFALRQATLGGGDPRLAASLATLGRLRLAAGAYAAAEAPLERALAIREATLGDAALATASSAGDLAELRLALEEPARARDLFLRALAIEERSLGPGHPALADRLDRLAAAYEARQEHSRAWRRLERARGIRARHFGEDSPEVAVSHRHLGRVYARLGYRAEGEAQCRRARAIDEAVFGPEHPRIADDLLCLARLLILLDDM